MRQALAEALQWVYIEPQALGKGGNNVTCDRDVEGRSVVASKPAEYSLGVMYFQGNGVPAERPLGTAWMKLAAERGNPQFTRARNAMVALLTPAEVAEADNLASGLRMTYGHQATLPRARLAERDL